MLIIRDSAQAPASRCKRFARSAIDECGDRLGSQALKRAANTKRIKNAERDLHRLFRNVGLTLPLTLSCKKFLEIAYVKGIVA